MKEIDKPLLETIIKQPEEGFINTLVLSIEARDPYTRGHSHRVAFYGRLISQGLNLDISMQRQIYIAGLLHDIGKIGIPDSVLFKSGSLKNFEIYSLMVRAHHERIDGKGYPDRLKDNKIYFGAKILAIADVFDALTTSRPYRGKFAPIEAIHIMSSDRGHFDETMLNKGKNILIKAYLGKKDNTKDLIIPEAFGEYRLKFSDIDQFTGLFNRSTLVKYLKELIEIKSKFVLFLVDIKDLSLINLKEGSTKGDEIILRTATYMKTLKQITKLDILAPTRAGGDSFMFILVYKEHNEIKIIKTHLKNLNKTILRGFSSPHNFNLQYSVSYANYPENGVSPDELIYICKRKKKEGNLPPFYRAPWIRVP
jgi:diguanylate cyclase (GGDEF)-like protein